MSRELIRDDSLPYREFIQRPGDNLDYSIEWSNWLANRWFAGIQFAAGSAIRPRVSTGFEYSTVAGGMSGAAAIPTIEPQWPIIVGVHIADGAIDWVCQPISSASLVGTIVSSNWTVDSPFATSGANLVGNKALILASDPAGTADGDYYLRNTITLVNGVSKIGTFLLRSRVGKI